MDLTYSAALRDGGAEGPNVAVRESSLPSAGRGVFARRPIPRGSWITTYHGVVLPCKLVPREDLAYSIDFPADDGDSRSLVGEREPRETDGVAQLVNDSMHPRLTGRAHNCDLYFYRAAGAWILIASRDIARGEELFVSYGYAYWRGQWKRALAAATAAGEIPPHLAWIGRTATPIEYLTRTGLAFEFTEDIDVLYDDDLRVCFRGPVRVLARCHVPICGELTPAQTHPDRRIDVEVEFVRGARLRVPREEIMRVRCATCDRAFVRLTHKPV